MDADVIQGLGESFGRVCSTFRMCICMAQKKSNDDDNDNNKSFGRCHCRKDFCWLCWSSGALHELLVVELNMEFSVSTQCVCANVWLWVIMVTFLTIFRNTLHFHCISNNKPVLIYDSIALTVGGFHCFSALIA